MSTGSNLCTKWSSLVPSTRTSFFDASQIVSQRAVLYCYSLVAVSLYKFSTDPAPISDRFSSRPLSTVKSRSAWERHPLFGYQQKHLNLLNYSLIAVSLLDHLAGCYLTNSASPPGLFVEFELKIRMEKTFDKEMQPSRKALQCTQLAASVKADQTSC